MSPDLAGSGQGLWPYLVVIGLGVLPTAIWRVLAVFLSRGMAEGSEILDWVQAVATTLLAGVVATLLFTPSGALAAVPAAARFGSLAAGLAGFLFLRRSLLAGVLTGEATLFGFAWIWSR